MARQFKDQNNQQTNKPHVTRPDGRCGRLGPAMGVGPPVLRVVPSRARSIRQGDEGALLRLREQVRRGRRRWELSAVAAASAAAAERGAGAGRA